MIFIASRGILLRQLRPLLLLCLLCHLHDVLLHQFCLQLERCFAFHLNNSNGSVGMWLDPGMGQRRHPHIARTSSINGSTTIAAVEPITHAQSFALPTTWCKQRTRARSDCHSETGTTPRLVAADAAEGVVPWLHARQRFALSHSGTPS